MNIMKFVSKLLPSLERNDVVDDLSNTISSLEKIKPAIGDAVTHFTASPMKSEENEYLRKEFYKNWTAKGSRKSNNFLEDILNSVDNIIDNAKYIQDSLQQDGSKYIVSESLTAKKAAVLAASGRMAFVARYVPDLLNVIYANEAIAANADLAKTLEVKAPTRIFVNKNIGHLGVVITDYGMPRKEFEKLIGKIPDVFVSGSNADLVSQTYRPAEIDPFASSSLISRALDNPIFELRMVFAQWQVARHNNTKYKLEQLKLRLLHLQAVQEQKNSPAMEKEIQHLQDRIDKIDREIHETEKALGV